MPGYVMHLAEERMILDQLKAQMTVSDEWEQRFRTGTLLPDTKLRDEKPLSHFWKPEEAHLLARSPDLDAFMEKYGDRLDDPLVFGYLAHLHLDGLYLQNFWPAFIRFDDARGNPETVREKVTDVLILKNGRHVPVNDFFSPRWYYGEYGKLNYYFVKRYGISLPDWQHAGPCTIDEVNMEDLSMILSYVGAHLDNCRPGGEQRLQIFDLEAMNDFIRTSADTFINKYGKLLRGGRS